VSFAAVTLCVASQQAIPKVSMYFFIDSVRKLLNTPSFVYCENSSYDQPFLMKNINLTGASCKVWSIWDRSEQKLRFLTTFYGPQYRI
jgi:hypothetical protein